MKEEKLNEKAIKIGKVITDHFTDLKNEHSEIGDVRGMGAMVAIEFVKNNDPRQPNGEICSKILKGCTDQGLVLITAGTFKNVIRILSPIVISDEQLMKGLNILSNEIKKATKK